MNQKPSLKTLYEDDHLFAVNKPARLHSVEAPGADPHQTLLGKMRGEFAAKGIKPYPLHRLDYETSGIMLFGKFPRDREMLEGIFRQTGARKKYIALVKGRPRRSEITIPLPSRQNPSQKSPSKTNIHVLKTFPGKPFPLSLVEATIETGRKHQIRQHLSKTGSPVLLDQKYGDEKLNRAFRLNFRLGRLFLHAASMEFTHPFSKKNVRIEAPLPMDLQSVLKKLA